VLKSRARARSGARARARIARRNWIKFRNKWNYYIHCDIIRPIDILIIQPNFDFIGEFDAICLP